MTKPIKMTLVALMATMVAACDQTTSESEVDKPAQRDVYTSLEDCVADWGDTELCERQIKEAREHAEKMAELAAKNGGGGGGIPAFIPLFYGPTYYGNDRYHVDSRGDRFVPNQQRARNTVGWNSTNQSITSIYRPNPTVSAPVATRSGFGGGATSTTSRGGFGSTGSSSSSSSSGG